MRAGPTPPRPADLYHLKPGNLSGAVVLGGTLAATLAGSWLSSREALLPWALGQITTRSFAPTLFTSLSAISPVSWR
jgi:hypothetical protein